MATYQQGRLQIQNSGAYGYLAIFICRLFALHGLVARKTGGLHKNWGPAGPPGRGLKPPLLINDIEWPWTLIQLLEASKFPQLEKYSTY